MRSTLPGGEHRPPELPRQWHLSLIGLDTVFVKVLMVDRYLHGRQLHTTFNNALGIRTDFELTWAQLCPELPRLRILESLLHAPLNLETWGVDPRRPLLFWGGRVGQSMLDEPTRDLGHATTRLHIALLYPHWREDLLRDRYQELTCNLPLGVDLTSTLLRLLVENGWLVPTVRLELCLQSGRQPTEDLTIRQMLLLQPELMGEWMTERRERDNKK